MIMKDKILSLLPADFCWRDKLHYFSSTDSTNAQAKKFAAGGAPHGTVLLADHQTEGRGRLGRSFHSPANSGLYLSVLLRPKCNPTELMHLTCAAAVAVCEGLEAAVGICPGIKWTNDLVIENRKIAGILTELSISPKNGTVEYAIVGIGINCSQQPSDFPEELSGIAGSLAMATGAPVPRELVAARFLGALAQMDLTKKAQIMTRYRRNCVTLNRDVSLVHKNEVVHAHALDVNDDGALIVQFADGTQKTVNSGEVSVRGMYGYL